MPEKNLILEENEFKEFQKYCKGKGFDLVYFCETDSDLKKALENERAKIGVRRFKGKPRIVDEAKLHLHLRFHGSSIYDVAEWQREKWVKEFHQIYEDFSKERR